MLATDRFLFISSGRTRTGCLHRWLMLLPRLSIVSAIPHEPHDSMAQKCLDDGLKVPPAWTIVRNPWARYVDLYFWNRAMPHRNDGTFKEFMQKTREGIKGCPSFTGYWDAVGSDNAVHVARYENYDDDVVRILMLLIPDLVTKGLIEVLNAHFAGEGDSFVSKGRPWRLEPPKAYMDFYDDESYQWVYQMDAKLIDRFDYKFGDPDYC